MIYITLTTVPDRMAVKEAYTETLTSLLEQDTTEPYKILLNIPTTYSHYPDATIPDWLQDFIAIHDKIVVIRDDIDYGPISNLLYPMKHVPMDPEDILIVCDDDHVYEPTMISYHLKKLAEYPVNHCICFRGNQPMELRTWILQGKKWGRLYGACALFPVDRDMYMMFADHWHSISYRRKFLQDDMFDPEFLGMTWHNDYLMGYYARTHGLYFLCAKYDNEIDHRPVNYDGRGAWSYPITRMQSVSDDSGCYRYRQIDTSQIWDNEKFAAQFKTYDAFEVEF